MLQQQETRTDDSCPTHTPTYTHQQNNPKTLLLPKKNPLSLLNCPLPSPKNNQQFASLSAAAAQASTAAPSYEDSDPEGTPSASTTGIIGETVVIIASDGDSGLTKVTLITGDRNGLMADVGSAFSSLGMSVQYAEMKSGSDGFVENSFVVSGPDCGPIPAAGWENLKSRLKASCSKRGRGRPWQERESRLRELFSRIDTMETGFIAQEDLDMFAQSLRMPRAFVHDFVDEVGLYKLSSVDP